MNDKKINIISANYKSPDFTKIYPENEKYNLLLIDAINWIESNISKEKLFEVFKIWLKDNNLKDIFENLDKIKFWQLGNLPIYAYIEINGGKFNKKTENFIKNKIEEISEKYLKNISDDEDLINHQEKNKITQYMDLQAIIKQYILKNIGNIEKIINYIKNNNIDKNIIEMISEDLYDFIQDPITIDTSDKKHRLLSIVNNLLKLNYKNRFIIQIIKNTIEKNKTKTNVNDISVKSKNNKFYKEKSIYGINSLKPHNIINSKFLLTFDDDNRYLNIFYSKDQKGLYLSNRKIKNIDDNKSFTIKIKNPENILKKLIRMEKDKIENILNSDKIKTVKQKVKPLLTNRTVILYSKI